MHCAARACSKPQPAPTGMPRHRESWRVHSNQPPASAPGSHPALYQRHAHARKQATARALHGALYTLRSDAQ
eukprot:5718785-Lingulodinium_polyedra.AAC.1